MEAVGAFSAILTIATEFDRIYRRLRRYVKNLKYARDDISAICDEVEIFKNLLGMFHWTVTDTRLADGGLSRRIRSSTMADCIVRSGNTALRKLRDILDDVKSLRTDKEHHILKQWYARWKWLSSKDAWMPIQLSLIYINGSANLLITMIYCQDLVHRTNERQAGDEVAQKENLQQLALFTRQAKTLVTQCKQNMEECRHIQDRQGDVLQTSQAIAEQAFHLTQSHIETHPELGAVLHQKRVPSFNAGNPTTSTNSGSSGSPQIHSAVPRRPRRPRGPGSGASSGNVRMPGTPAPMSEIPRTEEHANVSSPVPVNIPVSGTPVPISEIPMPEEHANVSSPIPVNSPESGSSSSESESGASETQPPVAPPAGHNNPSWIRTAIAESPEPRERPPNPRQSDATLSERPVIVDDGRGLLREEYRRPRKGPKPS